jgi:hypothetical protein
LGQLDLFFRIAFQTLPSGTTSNYFRFGLVDTGVAWTNAAYIEMAVSSGAPSWWLNCTKASAGASSTAVTTPAIAAYSSSSLTFYKLQLTVNAAATSVTAYANGNLIGTVTSDIPTANLIPIFFIGNQASATANYFLIDRFYYRYQVVV